MTTNCTAYDHQLYRLWGTNCTAVVMALASFPSAMLAKGASEEPQHSVY